MVFTEPMSRVQFRHGLEIANWIHIIASELSFQVLVASFTGKSRILPKATVVAYAQHNPLALLASDEEMARGIEEALNIPGLHYAKVGFVQSREDSSPTSYSTDDVKWKPPPDEGSSTATYWRSKIDLSHIECAQMRTRLLDILWSHASMWDERLGTIRAEQHRIPLEMRARPIRSMLYRQFCPDVRSSRLRSRINTLQRLSNPKEANGRFLFS